MLEEWNTGRMGSKPNAPLLMVQKSMGNRGNDLKGKEEEFVSAFTNFVEHLYMSMGD